MKKDTPFNTVEEFIENTEYESVEEFEEESEEIVRDLTERRMAREADSCSINVEMEAYNGS